MLRAPPCYTNAPLKSVTCNLAYMTHESHSDSFNH